MSSSNNNDENLNNQENLNQEDKEDKLGKEEYLTIIDEIFVKTKEFNDFIQLKTEDLKKYKKLQLTNVFNDIIDNKIKLLGYMEKKIQKSLTKIYSA